MINIIKGEKIAYMCSVLMVLGIYNFRHCLACLASIAGMVRKPPCKKLRKIKLSEYGSGVNKS